MLQAVVFDLDDTLYPEREFVLSGFRSVSKWVEQNTKISFADAYGQLVQFFEEDSHGHTFDRFLKDHDIWSASIVQKMVGIYRGHRPEISSFPEVLDMMARLGKRFRIGLLSDGYLDVQQRKLDALGLEHCFNAVVFSDKWGKDAWKPSPYPFNVMLEIFGVRAVQAVYVADNPVKDFLGARRAGMSSVRVRLPGGVYSKMEPETSDHMPSIEITALGQLEEALLRIDCGGAV
ncbi:MAG: HAD family hydrolase [Proteobacteria bacterium]|nr:HAD family hydrolase [Pseudomonadota bacterium]